MRVKQDELLTNFQKQDRLATLTQKLGYSPKAFPKSMHSLLYKDYLVRKFPQTSTLKVIKTASQIKLFIQLLPTIPPTPKRLAWFVDLPDDSRPMELIKEIIDRNRAFRENRDLVVKGVWEIVIKYLSRDDAVRFSKAFPNLIPLGLVEYSKSDIKFKKEVEKCIDDEFNWLIAHFTEQQKKDLLKKESFIKIFDRVSKFPSNKTLNNPQNIATQIVDFEVCSKDREQRRENLKQALVANSCTLRDDSSICKAFINKTSMISIEEVVGIVILTQELFGYGHTIWSQLRLGMESRLEEMVYERVDHGMLGISWIEAAEQLVASEDFRKQCDFEKKENEKRRRWYEEGKKMTKRKRIDGYGQKKTRVHGYDRERRFNGYGKREMRVYGYDRESRFNGYGKREMRVYGYDRERQVDGKQRRLDLYDGRKRGTDQKDGIQMKQRYENANGRRDRRFDDYEIRDWRFEEYYHEGRTYKRLKVVERVAKRTGYYDYDNKIKKRVQRHRR